MDTFRRYETREGDRWDTIASLFRDNQYDYVDIIQRNSEFQGEFVLPAGVIILVPVKEQPVSRLIPPWEQN